MESSVRAKAPASGGGAVVVFFFFFWRRVALMWKAALWITTLEGRMVGREAERMLVLARRARGRTRVAIVKVMMGFCLWLFAVELFCGSSRAGGLSSLFGLWLLGWENV